jgi:hypothetical protein
MAQPHKGPRKLVLGGRVHTDVYDRMDAEVKRLGVSKSDFVAHALCSILGIPEHDPIKGLDEDDEPAEPMRMTA